MTRLCRSENLLVDSLLGLVAAFKVGGNYMAEIIFFASMSSCFPRLTVMNRNDDKKKLRPKIADSDNVRSQIT